MTAVNQISRRQFEAYCYVRQPTVRVISKEVEWFEAGDRKLLGIIILDRVDGDFGSIILGRDNRRLFRCIWVSPKFHCSQEAARLDLVQQLEIFASDGQHVYPQGDETEPALDLMEPIVPEEHLHNYFKILRDEPRYEAARALIREIAYSFVDVDGNYIQQFQTNGFNARLWELFLHMLLYNAGFERDKRFNSPDFCGNFFGFGCCFEAVTVGKSDLFDVLPPISGEEVLDLSTDYMPIKYGSALYSKMKKEYWDMPHVKSKPLIFAVHDYHQDATDGRLGSMTWSRAGLYNYLYGVRLGGEQNKENWRSVFAGGDAQKRFSIVPIVSHKYKNKEIPSGFFYQPGGKNVSAVLFSNGATITTFNRMGKLAGLGSSDIKMVRRGVRWNPDGCLPIPFAEDVDAPSYDEAWGDTVVMYHNPFANNPIPPEVFPEISHVWFDYESKQYAGVMHPSSVLSSATFVLSARTKKR